MLALKAFLRRAPLFPHPAPRASPAKELRPQAIFDTKQSQTKLRRKIGFEKTYNT